MANWLQKRLKYLKLTHEQFGKRLAEQGIERSRVTITNWVNETPISLFSSPEDTKRLANALEWSVDEILIEAGYEIGETIMSIPPELLPHIKFYKKLRRWQQKRYIESITFVGRMLRGIQESDMSDLGEES